MCDLTEPVGLSQPTVSHHLKLLVEAGIMTREQREVGLLQAHAQRLERARRIDCLSGWLNRPTRATAGSSSGLPERDHRAALRRGFGSRRGWAGRPPRPCQPGRPAPSPRNVSPGRTGRCHRNPW